MKSDSGTYKSDSETNYSETHDSSMRIKWDSTCMSHVLVQPSADTSTLQPYLAHACTVLSTYKTNLPRPLEHTFMFTRRQFKIVTSSLANTCIFLLTNKANLPPLWATCLFFHQDNSKFPPRLANTCVVLLTTGCFFYRTLQNCHLLWQIHAYS